MLTPTDAVIASLSKIPDSLIQPSNTNGMGPKSGDGFGGEKNPLSVHHSTFLYHGYFPTEHYSHCRCQSGQGIRKCACPSWWPLRFQSRVLTWLALGATIVILQSGMKQPGNWDCSSHTKGEEIMVVQKGFFATALTSSSVRPRLEATGNHEIEKALAGVSAEVGESSCYHVARCVIS